MEFKHFTKASVEFLEDIAKNNNKDWFAANRNRYDGGLLVEAKAFTELMGERLSKIAPGITYAAKVDGSIFRIYKDARYHKGSPFKTHIGIIFWEGGERLKSPCFYFHIEPPFYSIGVGMTEFLPPVLAEYRRSLQSEKYGKEFAKIIETALKQGYTIGGKKRKTLPRGIKKGVLNEELLKYDYIFLSDETPINADFYADSFMDEIMKTYKNILPFHQWLVAMNERAANYERKEK